MAASDLDSELRRSAGGTAESILSAARADAEQIASDADRLIGDRRTEILKGKEAEYDGEARVAIAAERHAAMRAVLLAQTSVVDRVLERARGLLPEATQSDTYLSTLRDELTGALEFVEGKGAVVRCSAELAPAVRERLRDRPEVKVEPRADVGPGFVVVGAGGSVLVDGRLQKRVDRLTSVLAIEIHRRLEEP
jgi:vacuolar-type H+-ATPase subunit E/Vma4